MKTPIKKIKPRRFAEGGNTFSPEQEKFLGGADRTDPYILARMRKAVPDQAPVEDRIPTPVNQIKDEDSFEKVIKNAAVNDDGQVLETANKGEDLAASLRGENILKRMRDAASATPVKNRTAPTAARGRGRGGQGGPTADELEQAIQNKGSGDGFVMYKKGGQVKKMAAGGSVSSRGDGIAQRGKTRGKMC